MRTFESRAIPLCLLTVVGSICLLGSASLVSDQRRERYESVVTTGAGDPEWMEQGPASIDPSANYNQAGAIESILIDPVDRTRIFVGSVNGGVWRTNNGTASNPTWKSSTDQAASLSIGDLNFDPTDRSRNTIFAGVGPYSSFPDNGPLTGLLVTRDGGSTWTSLGSTALGGLKIRNVFPTMSMNPGQVVLVGADLGVYRSIDAGNTFALLGAAQGLPAGTTDVSSMVADPTSSTTFYAAMPGHGIFRTDDSGGHWQDITNNIPGTGDGGVTPATRIKLAVSAAAPNPIYAAVATDHLAGLYRSTNKGVTWTSLAIPDPQLNVTYTLFAFGADSRDPDTVYAAGYQGVNNLKIGQPGPNGQLTWSAITGVVAGRNIGDHHGDSRDIQFDSQGDLLLSDDGGLYRLASPGNPASRQWSGINGSLAITEVNSAAYDTLNLISFSGHQDTGTAQQPFEEALPWDSVTDGDGTEQGVDNSASDRTIRFYSTGGNLSGTLSRTVFGSKNQILDANKPVMLADPNTPTVRGSGFLPKKGYGGFILNKAVPSRMIFFGAGLHEGVLKTDGTGDYGDTIKAVPLPPDALNVFDNTHTAAVYGGWLGTSPNPGVIYVGFAVQESVNGQLQDFNRLYHRVGDGSPLVKLPFPDANLMSVAISPADWRIVYALGSSLVYKSVDAGQHWTNITGNLPLRQVRAVEVVGQGQPSGLETVVVGGDNGVYVSENGGTTPWTRLGTNLPNVIVNDIHYYPQAARGGRPVGDVLIVGTIGRGVWLWPWNTWRMNLAMDSTFQVHSWKGAWGSDGPIVAGDFNGDHKTDVMMWRDPTKSWTVNLSTGSGFNGLEWKGAWGSDGPMVVGDFNGDGKTDVMMWRDSTKSWTVNLSTGSGFNALEWKGAWGSDGPIVTGDFNGDGKTDVMMWRNSTKSWTVNLSTGSGFNALEWKGAWGSDGPMVAGDFNGDGKTDVMMWRDSTKSWTVNLSTGNGFNALEWKGGLGIGWPDGCGRFQWGRQDRRNDVAELDKELDGEPIYRQRF